MTRMSKQWIVPFLVGAIGIAAVTGPLLANDWLHLRTAPLAPSPCPPGNPCLPAIPLPPSSTLISPSQQPTPSVPSPNAPTAPQAPATEAPTPNFEPLVSAALGDTSLAVGTGAFVNMFGDQFRAGSGGSIIVLRTPGALNGAPITAVFPNAIKSPNAAEFTYSSSNPGAAAHLTFAGQTLNPNVTGSFVQAYDPNNPYKIPQNQLLKPTALLNSLMQPGTPVFQLANVVEGGKLVGLAVVNTRGEIVNVVTTTTTLPGTTAPIPGTTGTTLPGTTAAILVTTTTGDIQYDGTLQSTISRQFLVDIPNPSGGGVVGRPKISEDANPLPRDRFIFNYDYFNSAALTPNGIDVNRFVVGFEKTFFDNMTSIEVRLPFASTLDSTNGLGSESRNTELGNLRITPRGLLYRSDSLAVGAGLGIYLPTASDTHFRGFNGSDLVRIDNRTVILTPYLGTLWTPNNRFFSQAWIACDFDPSGNPVSINADGNGLRNIGRIREASYFQADLQLGYWVYNAQDNNRVLQALAPFAELHYGSNVNNMTTVSSGGFTIGDLNNFSDQLNFSAGFTSIVGNQTMVSVGAVVPLNEDHHAFDYQIGVRVNYFFGATAANRRQAYIR